MGSIYDHGDGWVFTVAVRGPCCSQLHPLSASEESHMYRCRSRTVHRYSVSCSARVMVPSQNLPGTFTVEPTSSRGFLRSGIISSCCCSNFLVLEITGVLLLRGMAHIVVVDRRGGYLSWWEVHCIWAGDELDQMKPYWNRRSSTVCTYKNSTRCASMWN